MCVRPKFSGSFAGPVAPTSDPFDPCCEVYRKITKTANLPLFFSENYLIFFVELCDPNEKIMIK